MPSLGSAAYMVASLLGPPRWCHSYAYRRRTPQTLSHELLDAFRRYFTFSALSLMPSLYFYMHVSSIDADRCFNRRISLLLSLDTRCFRFTMGDIIRLYFRLMISCAAPLFISWFFSLFWFVLMPDRWREFSFHFRSSHYIAIFKNWCLPVMQQPRL